MHPLKPTTPLYKFNGGLTLDLHHDESTGKPIKTPPLPAKLILPLQQHQGHAANLISKVGDYVFKGQPLTDSKDPSAVPVHASSSGNIIDICQHNIPQPSGASATCIIIEPDQQERWGEHPRFSNYRSVKPEQLIQHIHACGISGMGGASFPSAIKMFCARERKAHTLIINAAECEPYISCDDSLMRQYAEEIVYGINILQYCLNIQKCIIAIEATMPEAYAALEKSIQTLSEHHIELVVVPAIYPIGGERQLIKVLTNKEVPIHGLPADIGIICHNVATANSVYNAVIKGEPLISRIVTVTGCVKDPRNLNVLLGTPIKDLIQFCGGYREDIAQLTLGGSMMGYALQNDEIPITKASNCILAASKQSLPPPSNPSPCIRCGLCEQACPAQLLPQQLYWYIQAEQFSQSQAFHLDSCIECGCCSYVCPSHIPLVEYYRYGKSMIKKMQQDQHNAELAKQRYESRNRRIETEQRLQQESLEKKRKIAGSADIKSEIAAALARSKKK